MILSKKIYWQIIDIEKIYLGIIEKLLISKNVPPISSDKLNWKHCSKNKKKSVSYPRRIWNCLWKQCTKLRGNTRQTSWIVKDVHFFRSDSCKSNLATLKRSYIQRFYAFLSQNLIFGGNYRKSYRKSIYLPFSNYRSNYRYRFNTSLNYRQFLILIILPIIP